MSTARQQFGASRRASGHVWLCLGGVPRSKWGYEITSEPRKIGRSGFCAIRVGDPTVSREHAVVWLKEGVPHIRDLQSVNGTRVNGERIREQALALGNLIQIGQVTLQVCNPTEPELPQQARSAAEWDRHSASIRSILSAGGQLAPTPLEGSSLRDDLAAAYSLGGSLGLCSRPSEAFQHLLGWMREWLGVDQALVVFQEAGRPRVIARAVEAAQSATNIHWPTIHLSLAHQKLVTNELSGHDDEATAQGSPDNSHRLVLAAWIPGADPPGVIYGEWNESDAMWDHRCRELVMAAGRLLGEALCRMGKRAGTEPARVDRNSESWIETTAQGDLVGGSAMHPVREFIRRAAEVDATVLITGETGTGKELVARAIHQQSARGKAAFVSRNCGAFPEALLENELFGHQPGAFTGAVRLQEGVFDQAHRGTLLLDEIGEMPIAQQAKLLHVIEERSFQRVGGHRPVQVDVRIIAATNRDLARAATDGQFRRDLYYRLQVLTIELPPLRERPDDIEPLTEHFISLASKRWDLPTPRLGRGALRRLESHDWPGNIRELRNTIDRAVIFSRSTTIEPEHIAIIQSPEPSSIVPGASLRLEDVERAHIQHVMASVGGNKAKAAGLLGIDRSTLLRKLQRLNSHASDQR